MESTLDTLQVYTQGDSRKYGGSTFYDAYGEIREVTVVEPFVFHFKPIYVRLTDSNLFSKKL